MLLWTSILSSIVAVTLAQFSTPPQDLNDKHGYFVHLLPYDRSLHASMPLINHSEDTSRRQRVYDRLKLESGIVAAPFLEQFEVEFGVQSNEVEVFWIDKLVFVSQLVARKAARTFALKQGHVDMFDESTMTVVWINAIKTSPYVKSAFVNSVVASIPDVVDIQIVDKPGASVAWGVEKIRADKVWSTTTGRGVRIASIDTGVNWQHEALLNSYAGSSSNQSNIHDYAWYDPKEFRNDEWWCPWPEQCSPKECCLDEPFDIVGHGTHVMATIAGSIESGVGVAPGVEWMAAKGCRDGNCLFYGLTASAQWVMCPTRINGQHVDCSMGADIVSNSWGSKVYNPNDDFYFKYIKVWREAGIIPVFSNGNSGPSCASVSAPGAFLNVIGVGATDAEDRLAQFSSRGPGPNDEPDFSRQLIIKQSSMYARQKPDISAPGVKIISASGKNATGYVFMSGTSM